MEIRGLPPERLDRLRALVTELRPLLLEAGGMEQVQRLLAEREVEVMDAIIVTRELLGTGPESLTQAKATVPTDPGRKTELRRHERLADELTTAADHIEE